MQMDELRILIIAGELPAFPGKGSAIRLLHLSQQLAQDFSLSLICTAPPPDTLPDLSWFDQVEFLPFDQKLDSFTGATVANLPGHETIFKVRNFLLNRPLAAHFLTPPYLGRLERAIYSLERRNRAQFHGFLVETDRLAGIVRSIPTHGMAMLDCHVVSSINMQAEAEASPRRKKAALSIEARKALAYEQKMWPKFDMITLSSAEDKDIIARRGNMSEEQLTHIPNGVSVEHFAFHQGDRKRDTLLFVGDFATPSNVEAVQCLLNDVLPEIRRLYPSMKTVIACRNLDDSIRAMARPYSTAVEFVVDAKDMLPLYQSAFAFIGPYRSGGGARLTMLEAMACGLPVITSTFGLHGLNVHDRQQVLVADSPGAFGVALGELLEKKELYSSLQTTARHYVERTHQWKRIASRIADLFLHQHTNV